MEEEMYLVPKDIWKAAISHLPRRDIVFGLILTCKYFYRIIKDNWLVIFKSVFEKEFGIALRSDVRMNASLYRSSIICASMHWKSTWWGSGDYYCPIDSDGGLAREKLFELADHHRNFELVILNHRKSEQKRTMIITIWNLAMHVPAQNILLISSGDERWKFNFPHVYPNEKFGCLRLHNETKIRYMLLKEVEKDSLEGMDYVFLMSPVWLMSTMESISIPAVITRFGYLPEEKIYQLIQWPEFKETKGKFLMLECERSQNALEYSTIDWLKLQLKDLVEGLSERHRKLPKEIKYG